MFCRARSRVVSRDRRGRAVLARQRGGTDTTADRRRLGVVRRESRCPRSGRRRSGDGPGRRDRCNLRAVQHSNGAVHAGEHIKPVRRSRRVHAPRVAERHRRHEDSRLRPTPVGSSGSGRCARFLATRAGQHRRVGHGRRVRPDETLGVERSEGEMGGDAQLRRACHRRTAVHQLPADHNGAQPGADRSAGFGTICCRSPSTTETRASAWPTPFDGGPTS